MSEAKIAVLDGPDNQFSPEIRRILLAQELNPLQPLAFSVDSLNERSSLPLSPANVDQSKSLAV